MEARFGSAFKVEEGKIIAYDKAGNKIYSRSRAGEIADFDVANVLGDRVRQLPGGWIEPATAVKAGVETDNLNAALHQVRPGKRADITIRTRHQHAHRHRLKVNAHRACFAGNARSV